LKKNIYIVLAIIIYYWLTVIILCTSTFSGNPSGVNTNPVVSSPGGVLNLANVDPTTLDPAVSTETTSAQYIMEIYSGLLKLDKNLEPVADIAQSWDTSPDGTVYTFHLRQDVKFQNKKAVTASDFKYSWERVANPATRSRTASTYLGDIVGVNAVLSGQTSSISGLKVIDDYTLQLTIDSPKSYFLYKMTYPTTFVVDQVNVKSGANWWHKPNGTGPFKLDQWTQNQSLTLSRNEYYYGIKPTLSQVKYSFYSGVPMDLYETGDLDVTGVSTADIDKVMDKAGPFYPDLSISSNLSVSYIGFNCHKPPFDDVNVRKAFSLAIDKDKIIKLIYKDMEKRADGILPPGMPGYNPGLNKNTFDIDKAKELIKTSKYGDFSKLPPIVLTTYGAGGSVGPLLQALIYQWEQNLGVKVTIRQLEEERYFYNTKEEIDNMFDMAWSADYPHPQDFLDILFSSGSEYNYGGYNNTEFNALVSKANLTLNREQGFALYRQAEQILVDEAGCIPLAFGENYLLVKPRVKGFSLNPLGFAQLSEVSISK
jgi:oligopeptide transport system substrate-binding protein